MVRNMANRRGALAPGFYLRPWCCALFSLSRFYFLRDLLLCWDRCFF